METVRDLQAQIFNLWSQLNRVQRIAIGAAALAAIAIAVVLVSLAGTPDYSPVFTKLSQSDAGAVVNYLKAQKIPYKLADNG